MLLQKTSWRIKRFISPRKHSNIEKTGDAFDDERFTKTKLFISSPRRLSWLSQTSSAESPPLRRPSSNVTTRSHHLDTPSTTTHSSASSLCSCDCETNLAPIEHSLFGVDPLPPQSEILYLPLLPSESSSGDAKTWQLIFQEPLSRPLTPGELEFGPRTTSRAKIGCRSTFDVLGALALDLIDDDKTPTQSLKYTGESDMEGLSDNVEHLMRETDKAFQAVGTALADAKAATQGWHETPIPAASRSSSASGGMLKKHPQPPTSPLKTPATRAISMSKGKKKRASKRKTTLFSRSIPKAPPPPANTPARWTLMDVTTNMADVFSGKMFRTEVDEMLTPGRIQQLKNDKAESDRKISVESTRSFETDGSTPTEPFHLESLSSRITAAQQDIPSHVIPAPVTPRTSPRNSIQTLPTGLTKTDDQTNSQASRDGNLFYDYYFPAPPPPLIPPPATRRSSASRAATQLPTIPEISSLNLTPKQFSFSYSSTDSSRPSLSVLPPQTHIFLPSTHFTLTSPLFRHGPIRLDRSVRDRKGSSPEEEALDWIAFQMAISGTIQDDNATDHDLRDDRQWEADEAELDNIIEWYGSFGFQGYGRMESEVDVRERDEPMTISEQSVERRVPEPMYQQKRTWRSWTGPLPPIAPLPRNWNSGNRMTGWKTEVEIDTDKVPLAPPPQYGARGSNIGLNALIIPPQPPRRPSLAESLLSLPPSPMLDLVISGKIKDGEVPIPMGFNLGHDLGDFLSWGARHVQNML